MTDLQTILTAIDHLNADEVELVQHALETRRQQLAGIPPVAALPPDIPVSKLYTAIAAFWQGTSAAEKTEILAAMREKNIYPADPNLFAWFDALQDDER